MMLDHLGHPAEGDAVRGAVRDALAAGAIRNRRDGSAVGGTDAVTQAVVARLGDPVAAGGTSAAAG
jgi:isocitrate/isopropylmalate dehydrogenase